MRWCCCWNRAAQEEDDMVLRIAVLGAGDHSQRNHLPALADFARQHPGKVELSALCDLRFDLAQAAAGQFGFHKAFPELESMLAYAHWDACIAVTPVSATAAIARRILQAGIPLLMEKPPGNTPEEARQLAVLAEDLALPVMVSMNRRFDPALQAGLDWMGGRHLVYVRATQARVARREPEFITDTAIHALDALRFIAGEVGSWRVQSRQVAGVSWYAVSMEFENGTAGSLEILPDAGTVCEGYELHGQGFQVQVRAGGVDAGEVTAWESGTLVLNSKPGGDEPEYVANGCLAETTAFLENLIEGRPLQPTPGQVLGSVELCHHIKSSVAKEC
jgi:predicted dehydrogenase